MEREETKREQEEDHSTLLYFCRRLWKRRGIIVNDSQRFTAVRNARDKQQGTLGSCILGAETPDEPAPRLCCRSDAVASDPGGFMLGICLPLAKVHG
jgi:hypothetical protein